MNPNRIAHELDSLVNRARAEFRETPGMCVTTAQAARLWQLTPQQARDLLNALVAIGFLVRLDREHYRLPTYPSGV
jgi:DNA-binding IclR family transcriptional regulator